MSSLLILTAYNACLFCINFCVYFCFSVGYSALFRHANDEVGLCVYILPGNPEVTDSTLPKWHEFVIKEDPNVSRSIGKKAKMERMKAGKKAYMLATRSASTLLCCCSLQVL